MARRSVINLIDQAAASDTTVALPVPSWARLCVLSVVATTDGSSTYDLKVQQKNPDGSGTAIDCGVAIDQIGNTVTNGNRYVAFGDTRAVSGTSYDSVGVPLSKYMQLVSNESGSGVTNLKVWAEFVE